MHERCARRGQGVRAAGQQERGRGCMRRRPASRAGGRGSAVGSAGGSGGGTFMEGLVGSGGGAMWGLW